MLYPNEKEWCGGRDLNSRLVSPSYTRSREHLRDKSLSLTPLTKLGNLRMRLTLITKSEEYQSVLSVLVRHLSIDIDDKDFYECYLVYRSLIQKEQKTC